MEKKYGIFMKIGESKSYGAHSGSGLVKMNFVDFDSEDDAIEFINVSDNIPSNVDFYIIAFINYRKPNNIS